MYKLSKLFPVLLVLVVSCSGGQEGQNKEEARADGVNTSAEIASGQASESMGAAKNAFEKQYPNAQQVEWGEDSNGYFEANFVDDGDKLRADYTTEGKWVETEKSIKIDELPPAVKEVIEKQYSKEEITELEWVNNAERGVFFDVEFKDKGKNKDVEIRENGEILNQ